MTAWAMAALPFLSQRLLHAPIECSSRDDQAAVCTLVLVNLAWSAAVPALQRRRQPVADDGGSLPGAAAFEVPQLARIAWADATLAAVGAALSCRVRHGPRAVCAAQVRG
eukprot:NODE_14875_length_1080_cov_3.550892.p2 GENE.NODE_14875_length_1080_cov_3.550892~~NODE_14875_length_1080_cov_3.550892.p2  ORF type:complete len:110 (+),score=19.77 NODE_14875_length_1080_cov_3.550892:613-942(+)